MVTKTVRIERKPSATGTFANPGSPSGTVITPTLASFPLDDAQAALDRANVTVVSGTDDNGRTVTATVNNETLDGRNFVGTGYVDFDSTNNTGLCVAECGTAHGGTVKILRVNTGAAYGSVKTGTALVGGKLSGTQPLSVTWEICKHGRYFQNEIDAGRNPYPASSSNDGGALTVRVQDSSWVYIDGVRIYNMMDGVNFQGRPGADAYLRNVWVTGSRDTMISSEDGVRVHMFDCAFVSSYGLVDWRGGPDISGAVGMTIQASLISLEPKPGGFQTESAESVHDRLWKTDGNGPDLSMSDCLVKVGPDYRSGGAGDLPSSGTYSNVRVLWDSPDPWPFAPVPTGCDLVTGQAAVQQEWADALNIYNSRHGITDFDTVDMAKMIAPTSPPSWPLDGS